MNKGGSQTFWSKGVIIFLIMQTATAIWWASSLSAQVQENTSSIKRITNESVVYIDRDQLEDILTGDRTKIENIEKTLLRLESKLDQYYGYR